MARWATFDLVVVFLALADIGFLGYHTLLLLSRLWFLGGLLLFAFDHVSGSIWFGFLFLRLVGPRFCLWLLGSLLGGSNLLEDLPFDLDLLFNKQTVFPLLDGFVLDLHERASPFSTFDKPLGVGIMGLFLLAVKVLFLLLNVA